MVCRIEGCDDDGKFWLDWKGQEAAIYRQNSHLADLLDNNPFG